MNLKIPIHNLYQVISEPPKQNKKRKKRKRKNHIDDFMNSIPKWAKDTQDEESGSFHKGYKLLFGEIENLRELLLQKDELEL